MDHLTPYYLVLMIVEFYKVGKVIGYIHLSTY